MSTVASAPPDSASGKISKSALSDLHERLNGARQSVLALRQITGFLGLIAALTAALMGIALLDYFVEFSLPWRFIWLLGVLTGLTAGAIAGWKRWIAPYSLSRAAVDAEQQEAQFGQRLRTTLDYDGEVTRAAKASPRLIDALRRDTCAVAQKVDWDGVVDVRPVFCACAVAATLVLVLSIALLSSPDYRIAAGRSLLIPWDYTTVSYSPHAETVKIGESVEVKAEISGRAIASAVLRYREAGSQDEWTAVDLKASESDDRLPSKELTGALSATLADLRHDLEFEIVAGPRSLPPGAIRVLQPLTFEKAQARIVPPEYVHLPEEDAQGLDLKVREGSTVELTVELNRPAAEARLTPAGATNVIPVVVSGNDLRIQLADLRKSATFTLAAKAADGMTLDPQRVSIRVQLDRKPEIKFIQPPEELVVTATTEVPLAVEAADDIGLHRLGIMYRINDGELQTLCQQDAAGATEPWQALQLLLLEDHQLTCKDSVTYYAFAEDNYFGQPRRTTTPLRFIDIRPFKREFQLSEGGDGASQAGNGNSVTLEELIARQRTNLGQAFAAQDEQPAEQATADRLRESESDLAEKTREFAQGLLERGMPVPTLSAAAAGMDQAVAALESRALNHAVTAEQQALADLIRARENVRQKLCQSNSQSASACRKFDREQRQKLRLPEKKKDDRQQQLADVRSQLEKLAKQERQWSQQAQQCCKSGNSEGKPGQSQSAQASSSQQQKPSADQASPQASQERKDAGSDSKPDGDSESQAGEKSGQSDSPAPSADELAKAQDEIRRKLAALREQVEKLLAGNKAGAEQLDRADESLERGLQELARRDGAGAARAGERSADEMEQLSEHLAAMNARDFGKRLEAAHQLAQRLAARQESIDRQVNGTAPAESPGELARDERAIAGRAELLADRLEALARDSRGERGDLRQKIDRLLAENPPRDAAALMRDAASQLESKRPAEAGRGVAQSRERLSELQKSLGDLRSDYAQPELEELVALERRLAELLEQARSGRPGSDKREAARQKWTDLEGALQGLAARDRRLGDALRRMPEGHGWIELGDYSGATEVSKALQMKIQEAIIAAALMDSDQPIPAEYKALVEKYYRALSDDLR
ncbi:MAG: hypothetical protein HY290_31815 [Planctomycetia bacterium]|nr:hypothetical protein [Planctomycetia bacterium]